jgi:hypothetical protein
VTELDTTHKTISGNFQCKVFRNMDSHQEIITRGFFIKIPYVTSLPHAALGDTFQVKVGGALWIPPSNGTAVNASGVTVIGSQQDATQAASVTMPLTINPGNYKMDPTAGVVFGNYKSISSPLLTSDTSGTLTILENNALSRRIRGNFQFIARDLSGATTDSATLTEGYFSMGY